MKTGVATSIRKADLQAVQVFPNIGPLAPLVLTDAQRVLLSLFA